MNKKLKINATLWVSGGHVFSQMLRLGSNLILTRMLVPEVFGIMAIVHITLMGLAMFSDVGIRQSIIRHKDINDTNFLNTAWTIQVIRGLLLWLICIVIAFVLWLAQENNLISGDGVYTLPVLPLALLAVSFTAIIDGFSPTTQFTNNRDLKMERLTIIDVVSQICSIFIMVVWAWMSPTIWALVVGSLVGGFAKLTLYLKYLEGIRNTLTWDKKSVEDIYTFGKWIILASIVTFLAAQGDRLLLGYYISAKEFGVYVIAFFMSNSVFQMFTTLIHKIWFPVFCEVHRNESQKLKHVYYKDRFILDCTAYFIGGFLIASGSSIVHFLYDERYSDAGWMLEILSIQIAFGLGAGLGASCLLAKGKSKFNFISMLSKTIILFISVPLCYELFGLQGVVWAVGLNFIAGLPIIYWELAKEGLFVLKNELLPIPVLFVGYLIGSLL